MMNLKSIEKCHSLLGKKLRIRIHDGRIIEGILQAIDREMNLLLESAREFHGVLEIDVPQFDSTKEHDGCRGLGLCLIHGINIEKLFIQQHEVDELQSFI